MMNFKEALKKKLLQSRLNNYGDDNFDVYRFGSFPEEDLPKRDIKVQIKGAIKKLVGYKKKLFTETQIEILLKYGNELQSFYEQLNAEGRKLLVDIISYRQLGYKKVKLSRNNKVYWKSIGIANSLADVDDTFDPHFLHFLLHKHNLIKIGYDIQLYFTSPGVSIDFILEQYAYKSGDKTIISVEKGDVVLDLGACWGDTALYFASKTGENGKVYSFEFIPANINLFNMNISLNPKLANRIELIQKPVSNKSGNKIYFTENGPGSRIEIEPFDGFTGLTTTISIDDFVKNNNISKVDFIKMDIEGAEPVALEGAVETIKKFKPKLAIAIYHSIDDFVNIPDWIKRLNLGYNLFLGHYTIHSEETIIFAKV